MSIADDGACGEAFCASTHARITPHLSAIGRWSLMVMAIDLLIVRLMDCLYGFQSDIEYLKLGLAAAAQTTLACTAARMLYTIIPLFSSLLDFAFEAGGRAKMPYLPPPGIPWMAKQPASRKVWICLNKNFASCLLLSSDRARWRRYEMVSMVCSLMLILTVYVEKGEGGEGGLRRSIRASSR